MRTSAREAPVAAQACLPASVGTVPREGAQLRPVPAPSSHGRVVGVPAQQRRYGPRGAAGCGPHRGPPSVGVVAATEHPIRVRRAYDEPSPDDGARVLVDRLWPRGVSNQAAHLQEWAKDVAPSDELRRWYGHDPAKFDEFRRRYLAELDQPEQRAAVDQLRGLATDGPVTLITASKAVQISEAAVLADLLRSPA